jgi:hypothetical protein
MNEKNSTWKITCAMIAMGGLNIFWSPASCAIFISFYLTLNTIDFVKSLSIIKWGFNPLWDVKFKDIGYVTAYGFTIVTIWMGLRFGIARFKEKVTKAIVLKS